MHFSSRILKYIWANNVPPPRKNTINSGILVPTPLDPTYIAMGFFSDRIYNSRNNQIVCALHNVYNILESPSHIHTMNKKIILWQAKTCCYYLIWSNCLIIKTSWNHVVKIPSHFIFYNQRMMSIWHKTKKINSSINYCVIWKNFKVFLK